MNKTIEIAVQFLLKHSPCKGMDPDLLAYGLKLSLNPFLTDREAVLLESIKADCPDISSVIQSAGNYVQWENTQTADEHLCERFCREPWFMV